MKLGYLKAMLIVSIILSWLIIGVNLYSMATESAAAADSISLYSGIANSTSYVVNGTGTKQNVIERLFSDKAPERPSPCERIKASQIIVTDDNISIEFKGAEWASFTDTNSMDPVLDNDSYALEYVPKSEKELCVGDIASYSPANADGAIIHMIVEISSDDNGWYALFKGDNLPYKDPDKVRFSQIRRVVIGIVY